MPRWLMNALIEAATPEGYRAVATTDAPCHLWLRWSRNKPQRHPRTKVVRGLRLMGDVYYCFTAYNDIEQEEAGDTTEHTFIMSDWPSCETRWFYLWGTISGEASPSESPIWGRHLYYSEHTFSRRVAYAVDEATRHSGIFLSCPALCPNYIYVGRWQAPARKEGGGFRLRDITIPQYAEILNASLTFVSWWERTAVIVKSRISAEGVASPPNLANLTWPQFQARWNTRIGIVNWDNIEPWYKDLPYGSPEIKATIQAVVNLADWVSGNPVVIFWEDFEQRTNWHASYNRQSKSFTWSPSEAPILYVLYRHWQLEGVNP